MRRSAAPSQLSAAKRPRFCPPTENKLSSSTSETLTTKDSMTHAHDQEPLRTKEDILHLIATGSTNGTVSHPNRGTFLSPPHTASTARSLSHKPLLSKKGFRSPMMNFSGASPKHENTEHLQSTGTGYQITNEIVTKKTVNTDILTKPSVQEGKADDIKLTGEAGTEVKECVENGHDSIREFDTVYKTDPEPDVRSQSRLGNITSAVPSSAVVPEVEVRLEHSSSNERDQGQEADVRPSDPSMTVKAKGQGRGKFRPPSLGRQPLTEMSKQKIGASTANNSNTHDDEPKTFYYNVVWCKLSKKKHKKWEGDAIMRTKGRTVTLIDTEGKEIGRGSGYNLKELSSMGEGHTLAVGGKEVEVMSVLKQEDYDSGKCFKTAVMVNNKTEPDRVKPNSAIKPFVKPQLTGSATIALPVTIPAIVRPKFDPEAPGALVMPRPNQSHQWEHNRHNLTVVDVVVDPHVTVHLRPHQRAGVVFLYECIMGMKDFQGQGAILADEMGLGKTLQCIALIWTLYKQGPYGGKPIIKRTLIITPGSLVKNWVREFKKWLGNERLSVFAVGGDNKAQDFSRCNVYPVMIISYEMFIRNIEVVKAVKFDLVICDEGHRLKNTNIKTTSMMMSLSTRRRVVLTGTPVQNDLKELFSIVEFCNPGILGTSGAFHHVYEAPILASRQPDASSATVSLGESRAQELNRVTGMFIIRRTQDINNKYLPPKVEIVFFCRPSELQLDLYRKLLSSRAVRLCLSSAGNGDVAKHLACISAIKKLCNCPSLLYKSALEADERSRAEQDEQELYSDMLPLYPVQYDPGKLWLEHCGKLKVVDTLLHSAHGTTPKQKVVLVSNYTQTLDVFERLCQSKDYTFLRLDGKTPTGKRQQLVEQFNNKHGGIFVFLLSSKAGGVGLNLIGASRLILYDIDWNPANDLQAMARIWRDGQRNQVYIYRLLTTGTLEEKMYQRQVSKQGLSGVVVDAKSSSKLHFSPEELKDLFRLQEDTLCATHDLLSCDCQECPKSDKSLDPVASLIKRPCQIESPTVKADQKNICMDELLEWRHEEGPAPNMSSVDPLLKNTEIDDVTYAFWNISGQQPVT